MTPSSPALLRRRTARATPLSTPGQEDRVAWRLAQVLGGEIHRRENLLRAAGVANIEDYGQSQIVHAREPLPETFIAIDNLSWLHNVHFDAAMRSLARACAQMVAT